MNPCFVTRGSEPNIIVEVARRPAHLPHENKIDDPRSNQTERFLEAFTGVREPNVTHWRRKAFGDLTGAFRFGQRPAPPPILPETALPLHLARYAATHLPPPVIPTSDQQPPQQEERR